MSRRVVLLRAVNLGPRNKVPMARLRELVTGAGAERVETLIASGNLVCDPPGDPDDFDRTVERLVLDDLGVTTDAISRTADELQAALDAHPFEIREPKLSHVMFLAAEPDPAGLEALRERDRGETDWEVVGRDLHLRYPDGGVHRTSLSPALLAQHLGGPGTARNVATVRRLIDLARA